MSTGASRSKGYPYSELESRVLTLVKKVLTIDVKNSIVSMLLKMIQKFFERLYRKSKGGDNHRRLMLSTIDQLLQISSQATSAVLQQRCSYVLFLAISESKFTAADFTRKQIVNIEQCLFDMLCKQ